MSNHLAVEIFETLAILAITCVPLVWILCLAIFIGLLFTTYWYIPLLYLCWLIYDWKTPFRGGRQLPCLRRFFLWKYLASYFPAKLHKTANLDPSKNYLFASFPHGIQVLGGIVNLMTNATGFDDLFPGISLHMLVLNFQFFCPFYRDYALAVGAGSPDAASIDYKLTRSGPGHSVLLAVGGSAEQLLCDPNSYTLKLKTRKGFVKRALKTGALLVPVFSFNENRIYEVIPPKKGSVKDYICRFLAQPSIDVFLSIRGRWWLTYLLFPKKLPLNTVVGEPIDFSEKLSLIPKGEEAPDELVDECHKIFMQALTKLYDEHKARFGDENTPLIFV